MSDAWKVLLGALLSIAGGFLAEIAKRRWKVRASAKALLFELQRLKANQEKSPLRSEEFRQSLLDAANDFKRALFEVDPAMLQSYMSALTTLTDAIDSPKRQLNWALVLRVRRELAQLLDAEGDSLPRDLEIPTGGAPYRENVLDIEAETD